MENATKALLIAGGVLLAIIIISVGVTLYMSITGRLSNYSSKPETADLQQINVKFEIYRGKENILAQQIISIYNYIRENQNNIPYEINIKIDGMSFSWIDYEAELAYIKNNQEKTFKCTKITYNSQGQVTEIAFSKN